MLGCMIYSCILTYMKVIVGLGNPGQKYHLNRHNVGFMMLDFILKSQNCDKNFNSENKLFTELCELEVNNERIILVKPTTFMNESGKAVSKVKSFYKISLSDIFIIHDDLDIKLGGYKIQKGKGPKVHNGITSIETSLGTTNFWRVRIGVDSRDVNNRVAGETYVLENFLHIELEKLNVLFKKITAQMLP